MSASLAHISDREAHVLRKLSRRIGQFLQGGLLALALATPAFADDLPGAFRGNAYATFANVKAGTVAATLGRSAFQSCSCEGTGGQIKTNEVDSLSAGNILTANTTISTAYANKTATTAEVQNTSTITGLNALGGLITADAIKSVATMDATTKTLVASSEGSIFTNLVIAGQQIPATVPANTVIPLPGLGSVTLNKTTTAGTMKGGGEILVEMLSIDVSTKNGLGLPLGAKIVVAHAVAGFNRKQPTASFDGQAYAAQGNAALGDLLNNKIGKSAFLTIGCKGTAGKTKTSSIAAIDASGILSLGEGATTAFTGTEGGAQVARTTSIVSNVSLLGGLVQVGAIQAVATSSLQNGQTTGSTDGSGFAGLIVAGITIPLTTPPNTKLNLPGIGSITVNEQTIRNDGSVSVNGLHIFVSSFNLLGLPVGSELIVAHAFASATPF